MKEGWVFFCYHIISPPFLSTGRFYDFFFPKVGILRGEKKIKIKPPPKVCLETILGRFPICLGFDLHVFWVRFFFHHKSRGKKNPLKFLLSSYFCWRPTVLYVIPTKTNHPPLVNVLLLSLSLSLSKVKLFSSLSLSSGSTLILTYILILKSSSC